MPNNSKVIPLKSAINPHAESSLRGEALELIWFGGETISFNRSLADVTGDVLSALWLTHVLDQRPATLRAGRGYIQGHSYTFTMTGQECQEATSITRAQQATCRKQLAELGILSESSGRGKTIAYTIHLDRLLSRLEEVVATPVRLAMEQAYAPKRQASGG